MPTVAAMSVIVIPSARSKIIRARLASPADIFVACCHTRSVCRWAGVRWILKEVLRPRVIQRPLGKSSNMTHVGRMAVELERLEFSSYSANRRLQPTLRLTRALPTPQHLWHISPISWNNTPRRERRGFLCSAARRGAGSSSTTQPTTGALPMTIPKDGHGCLCIPLLRGCLAREWWRWALLSPLPWSCAPTRRSACSVPF